MTRPIGIESDTLFEGDRARDHGDHARDHGDHARDRDDRDGDQSRTEPFERKPGYRYAENYRDPVTGRPLQVHPLKEPDEFDSRDEFFEYLDALTRWNSYLPARRPMPKGDEYADNLPTARSPRSALRPGAHKSRHVGVRLTKRDFELLDELARAHAVPPGTMARMLIVRAVRAAADGPD